MGGKIVSLFNCPECNLPVSTRAHSCPHCGYPMHPYDPEDPCKQVKRKKKSHLRLPNGFGQITELKNRNLRNPFRAMVTVGKTDTGKPISKILKPQGYFATYNEAYAALMEYNKNPYDLSDVMTVEELYEKWTTEYFSNITPSSKRTIESAWAYCSGVYKMQVREIRVRHIKSCIDNVESENIKSRIKSLFNLMLDYALEYELVDKNYARDFKYNMVKTETDKHKAFTQEEMNVLWDNEAIPFVSYVLIQCYTGFRPQELCKIRLEDVDFDNGFITGGMKTDAGRNRMVPICDKIKPIVKKIYSLSKMLNSSTLICDNNGKELSYDKYYKSFTKAMGELQTTVLRAQTETCTDLQNIKLDTHRPHDPRKQFITMSKNAGMDEYAIKRIVGHAISDLTEKVYTERNLKWLTDEINKLK